MARKQSISAEEMFCHEHCFEPFANSESGLTGALAACSDTSGLFITAPKKMKALSGSCLLMPCNFSAKSAQKFDRETSAVWIKHDHSTANFQHNVVFQSRGMVKKCPMNLTGNLSQTNCTTMFSRLIENYTDKYFFRIESKLFKATAICDPLQIEILGKRVSFDQS